MKQLLDIEVFHEHFEVSMENYKTREPTCFMVNKWRDDRIRAKHFFNNYTGFIIHFNGCNYDIPVLAYAHKNNWFLNESVEVFNQKIKAFSDQVISDELGAPKEYIYFFTRFTQIDLYLFWARLLRLSKKISLKALGIQLRYPVVQELPFHPNSRDLTEADIAEIHHYCSVHDLGILRMLCDQLEGSNTTIPLGNLGSIQLRSIIFQQYGINAWSMDAPKIASETLIQSYCKKTKQNPNEVRKWRFPPPTFSFGSLFKDIDFGFKTDLFKGVHDQWMQSYNTFSHHFPVINPSGSGIMLSVGVGGIHNIMSNKIYESNDEYVLKDIDIESLYPTFIINYSAFRFPEMLEAYSEFKHYRVTETKPMIAKTAGTKEELKWKLIDAFYKVILNGTSGHLDSEHSCLFNREGIMKVRCGGQLVLMTLIEDCMLNDVEIIQVNTDGMTVKIHKSKLDWFDSIVKQCEQRFNVKFEYQEFKKMVFSSVNDYLAISTNGKVKEKGLFVRLPELGNSTDFLIIPHLLYDYFVKGEQPRDAIHKYRDIFLFCASQKVDKKFKVSWNGSILPQRLNRYYVSKKGSYLYKIDGKKQSHMLKGWGVMLYNKHEEKPFEEYGVNLSYYLSQTNNLIAQLQSLNQGLLC